MLYLLYVLLPVITSTTGWSVVALLLLWVAVFCCLVGLFVVLRE